MNTFRMATASSILLLTGVTSALAVDPTTTAQPQNNAHQQNTPQHQSMSGMNIRQQLETTLDNDGYKNVQIMPSSFLIRATDKQGNPVMMVISPDSVTEVTQVMGTKGTQQAGGTTETNGTSTKQ